MGLPGLAEGGQCANPVITVPGSELGRGAAGGAA